MQAIEIKRLILEVEKCPPSAGKPHAVAGPWKKGGKGKALAKLGIAHSFPQIVWATLLISRLKKY
jgi:hypothetical protein